MLVYALAAAAGLLALASLLLYHAGRQRARALADDVKRHIEPYVRRKAAELHVPAEAPTWTARTPPEEIVAYSARVAARLLAREKKGPTQQHDAIELAETQPVDVSDEIVITGKK